MAATLSDQPVVLSGDQGSERGSRKTPDYHQLSSAVGPDRGLGPSNGRAARGWPSDCGDLRE